MARGWKSGEHSVVDVFQYSTEYHTVQAPAAGFSASSLTGEGPVHLARA